MKSTHHLFTLLSLLVIVSMACNLPMLAVGTRTPTAPAESNGVTPPADLNPSPTPFQPQGDNPRPPLKPTPTPPADVYSRAFADYPIVEVNIPTSKFTGYTLPVDLGSVQLMDTVKLSDAQKQLLSQQGFVVASPVVGQYREFYQIYEYFRYGETTPLFVTTDVIFHVYHLIFDKMLRDLETDSFIPTLNDMTSGMLSTSLQQMKDLAGTPLAEPARRNAAFFGVAAKLLQLPDPIPSNIQDLVNAEVDLIEKHGGATISPLWDRPDLPEDQKLIEDYGQYVPRGHYTRSEELKRYFKAMVWYGRMTFRLRDTFETQRALLATQAIRNNQAPSGAALVQLWQTIYEPTTFIVGKSDDLSFQEYGALSDSVFGKKAPSSAFADQDKLNQFLDAAKQLPPPQINSMWVWISEDKTEATQGFRLMGQRFTLDQYVFGQVMWRNVGTIDKPRMLPKGLDFFAALGSSEALDILNQSGETQYANYNTQMQKVQGQIGGLTRETWTQNLYWSWLYAFLPVIAPKDERFPEFMRTQAWNRHQLNTVLGSWTELKHDTLLYAKQVMAEMGGGDNPEPPKGYVEPVPETYARMLALTEMTSQGLQQRHLLSDTTKGNLENLIDLLKFLQSTAERELSRQPLSSADYDRIRYIGGQIEAMTLAASDREGTTQDYRDLSDNKAALVADVATGMGKDGQLAALTEAIGQPTEIFVILPDKPLRIAVGGVYSYYEFEVNSSERLTDEQWQAKVEQGNIPPLPEWTSSFMAP